MIRRLISKHIYSLDKNIQCIRKYSKNVEDFDFDKEERQFGLCRDGFKSKNISGHMKPFQHQILIKSGISCENWPTQIEEISPFASQLQKTLIKRKMPLKIKTCLIEDRSTEEDSEDLILLPSALEITSVKPALIQKLVNIMIDFSEYSSSILKKDINPIEKLLQSGDFKYHQIAPNILSNRTFWVLVCCHSKRDLRCGYCGPLIYEKFKEKLTAVNNGNNIVNLHCVSHLGGHEFATNVLIYKFNSKEGCFIGDLFSYVSLVDVDRLIDNYMFGGNENYLPTDIWSGRVGYSKEQMQALLEKCKQTQ